MIKFISLKVGVEKMALSPFSLDNKELASVNVLVYLMIDSVKTI